MSLQKKSRIQLPRKNPESLMSGSPRIPSPASHIIKISKNPAAKQLIPTSYVFIYMIRLIAILAINSIFGPIPWHYNLDEARRIAEKDHRHILLNFSGSDWCGPCIRMHREIFSTDVFEKMADTSLILVNADFPRMKKDQLPAAQQQLNDAMADKYNSKGKFPYTLLLSADGKVLKTWDGFPGETPQEFAQEVKTIIDADQ